MTESSSTPDGAPAAPGADEPTPNRSLAVLVALGVAAVVAVVVLLNLGGGSDDAASAPNALAGFAVATPVGGELTFADLEGQPLVVNYFASWCAPCRAELPHFSTVSTELAESVTFVGVSKDTKQESWLSFIDEVGVSFNTYYEGATAGSYEFLDGRAMPATAFVRADGTVAEMYSGILSEGLLRDKIEEHLING